MKYLMRELLGITMMLRGKKAIITGTNRGIGRAILEVFAQQGADIWACVRNADEHFLQVCSDLSKNCGVNVKPVSFEMTDDQAIKIAVKSIKDEKSGVDILVNNAGIVPENRLFHMSAPEEMQRVFAVNFFAAMKLTQMVTKIMIRQKSGAIVNIASISALDGEPGQIEYVSSKAALIGATKKLASELGVFGIRINAVAPGVINTGVSESMSPELKAQMEKATIMNRLGEPKEIANVVAFLASDLSSYMTGQILRVDGGLRK